MNRLITPIVGIVCIGVAYFAGRHHSEVDAPHGPSAAQRPALKEAHLPSADTRATFQRRIEDDLSSEAPVAQDIPAQVAETVREEVERLNDTPALDAYLDELETRARTKGLVSALEVEPGMMAIEKLLLPKGPEVVANAQADYARRMTRLSRSLRGLPEQEQPPEVDFDALYQRIAESSGSERQKHIGSYLEGLDFLEPEEREVRLAELDTLVVADKETRAEGDLWEHLQAVRDATSADERRQAVRHYLDAADNLDPERTAQALADLDRLVSR